MAVSGEPKVVKTMGFNNAAEAKNYLVQMRAQYRKNDPYTGKALYKTPANVVFRVASPTQLEVLTNCVC